MRSVSARRAGQDMGPGAAADPSDAIDIVVVNLAPPGDDIGPDDLAAVALLLPAAANHEWVAAV